jgi:hypothetical protein
MYPPIIRMMVIATQIGSIARETRKPLQKEILPQQNSAQSFTIQGNKKGDKTNIEPTSGMARTTTAGIPTIAKVVSNDFCFSD